MVWKKALSDSQESELVNAYLTTDKTRQEIASEYSISVPTVQRIIRRAGYSGVRLPRIDDMTKSQIIDQFASGKPAFEIAIEFDVDRHSVYNIARRQGE